MKQILPLFLDYNTDFQVSNFKILKIQDFLQNSNQKRLCKNHKSDFYTIMLITDGLGIHTIDQKDFSLSKGTLLAIRKDQPHKFHLDEKVKGHIVFFKEEFLNRYLSGPEISNTLQMFNELLATPKIQLEKKQFVSVLVLIKNLEKEFTKISDHYSLKIIRSLLHILLSKIHRIKSSDHKKVRSSKYLKEFIAFQNLVELNYRHSKKVGFYSSELGFSTKKLNAITKHVINKSAKLFIDDVIIVKSKRDLLNSDLTIKEVAYNIGFKEPTNFFKYFRKHTGFTPDSFKKSYNA